MLNTYINMLNTHVLYVLTYVHLVGIKRRNWPILELH